MQFRDKAFCVHLPQTYLLMEKIITAYKKYLLFLCFAKDAFFFSSHFLWFLLEILFLSKTHRLGIAEESRKKHLYWKTTKQTTAFNWIFQFETFDKNIAIIFWAICDGEFSLSNSVASAPLLLTSFIPL